MNRWERMVATVKHLPALIAEARRDVAEGGLAEKAADYAVVLELANVESGRNDDVRDLAAERYLTILQVPDHMRADEMREEMSMARAVMSGYHLRSEEEGQK